MKVIVKQNAEEISKIVGETIVRQIQKKPNSVLGLATGSSPVDIYGYLVNSYNNGDVSFKDVTTFNLDEYVGLKSPFDSYHYYMHKRLFSLVDINEENTHFPNPRHPETYDELIKSNPIDLQILGLGSDGHIGFNEPGTPYTSITHLTQLTDQTLNDNSRFFKNIQDLPSNAATMGISTILSSKQIILIALGEHKKKAVENMLKEPNIDCPASWLNLHKNVTVYIDISAKPDYID